MYERFYGLRERPFELVADPRFVFLSETHREALTTLVYGIRARRAVTVLAGEAGTGKTTLARALMARPSAGDVIACLDNPVLTRAEFFATLAAGFGLGPLAARSKDVFLAELRAAATRRAEANASTALFIDEAQALSPELLEEVRLLTNLETPSTRLLSVVLSGQPELLSLLNRPALRPFKQRVTARAILRPLTREETVAYIDTRVAAAGGSARPLFTGEAADLIYLGSSGIPRTISVICDNALVAGSATRAWPVDAPLVLEVLRELDLPPAACEVEDARGVAGKAAGGRAGAAY